MPQGPGKMRSMIPEILGKPGPETPFTYRDLLVFRQYIRPYWKTGLLGLLLTLIAALFASLIPLSGKVLIDFVILRQGQGNILYFLESLWLGSLAPAVAALTGSADLLILAVCAAGMIAGLAGILQRYTVFRFQQAVTFRLQTSLFERLLQYPLSFFREQQTGYLMSRVTDDVGLLQHLISYSLPSVLASAFRLCFGIIMLFFLNAGLALICLALIPASLWINFFFAKRLMHSSMEERERAAKVSEEMQEVLSGIETIKSFSAEGREGEKVAGRVRAAMQGRMKSMLISLCSDTSARGFQFLITLVVMWLGAHEMIRERMTVGDFVAFTSYILYIAGPANTLSLAHVSLQPVFASLKRVRGLMGLGTEHLSSPGRDWRQEKNTGGLAVTFEHVSFGYVRERHVLRDVSFSLLPGQIVALTGQSGAGKTTLVSLMLKFYEPQSGAIRIDGRDLKDLPADWMRTRTGMVSQETFLFNDTIERNIRYGRADASPDEVVRAARMAGIHEEIENLPGKYQTVVGERGARLSAGQRQRISVARAFLRDPEVLILDEPTSDLDGQAEAVIMASLKKLASGRTTILISHSNPLRAIADRVFSLEDGRLREMEGFPVKAC